MWGKIKKFAGLSTAGILLFLTGCAQDLIQYRARIKTRPAYEINISLNDVIKGKTSKKEYVYIESDPMPKNAPCKISLEKNKYNAHFIMRGLEDLKGSEFEKVIKLNPEGRSKNCLEARVTTWEKGPSYDLLFRIPANMRKEIRKKEKPKEKIKIKPSKEPLKKIPSDIGKLVESPVDFFVTLGAGNTHGGFGACGGILFNLNNRISTELSVGLGYMIAGGITSVADSEYNTPAAEINIGANFTYWKRSSAMIVYVKGFGGIQGKAVGRDLSGEKTEEKLLFGMGIIAGNKWVIRNRFIILIGTGIRYTLLEKNMGDSYALDPAIEIGAGIKF